MNRFKRRFDQSILQAVRESCELWAAIRRSAASIALIVSGAGVQAAAGQFPDSTILATGPWQPVLLPGQRAFVFTMYGAPT